MTRPDLQVQRVRHALKFRLLRVSHTHRVTPGLLRVTLQGDELSDFVSDSFDDHIKVFFPAPGEQLPTLPEAGPNGPVFSEHKPRSVARDYTPGALTWRAGNWTLNSSCTARGLPPVGRLKPSRANTWASAVHADPS
nr:siderophore-interacting protein [Chitinimonas arctica]